MHRPPQPTARHHVASFQLCLQLTQGLAGAGLLAVQDVEVLLQPEFPPLIRVPDLSVVPAALIHTQPRRFIGDQVQLAVEIVSPGSARVDRIMKVADYADAGIPNYWIVDLDERVSLDAFRLADGRYEPVVQGATGRVHLEHPAMIEIDLDAVLP